MSAAGEAETVAVIGAGSWGTALAIQFARAGRPVRLWGRADDDPAGLELARENARYLPGVRFPDTLRADGDLGRVLAAASLVVVAVPSHALREVFIAMRPLLRPDARVGWATKGFERQTGKLPHQVAQDVLGTRYPMAVLSGPTFAREVGLGLPTALTVAATEPDYARQLATRLSGDSLRAYTSDDVVGVEVGGAVKNVLAIGAGICDGLGFGANTRVALITRGLVEMSRLGVALGAAASTFMGLAGIGDLMLTCTDNQSRNRRMGLALARGLSIKEAEAEIQQVVEGVLAAEAVHQVAQATGIEMPICEQIYRILYEGADPREAVSALMKRDLKPEFASDA